MILQTLKKIYPNKSETALKELEQDIRKHINGEIGTAELVNFASKLVMGHTDDSGSNSIKKDDSKSRQIGEESSFLHELEFNESCTEKTTEFPKKD